FDQAIPSRNAGGERRPEILTFAAVEILDRDALLLHPGVIAEVEDAFAIDVAKLKDVVVGSALHVPPKDFCRTQFIEAGGIAPGQKSLRLAAVKRCAVGGDGHDDVVGPIIEMLRDFHRGYDIGEPGYADILELMHKFGIELSPARQIIPADAV